MRPVRLIRLLVFAICASFASDVTAQEPATRADALLLEREEKAKHLTPPKPSGFERVLMDLESGRLFERILNPAEGLYPKIGNITSGSGFSLGPGYRHAGIFGGHADFSTFAAASFSKYWMLDARLQMPRLANNHAAVEIHAQRYDFPKEDFFGLGPDSNRDDEVTYGLGNTVIGGSGMYRPTTWLNLSAGVDHLQPTLTTTTEPGSLLSVFDPSQAPGVLGQPDFFRYSAMVDVNMRAPRGNPRRGGRYALGYQRYADTENDLFSFDRVDIDLQQYLPFLKDRRVIALRARAAMTDADAGAQVPFYLQPTLGGPDDLRGFRYLRFRDRNSLLLQAEYRWEIFTAMDGAIFYDAGKVASRREDLDLRELETDYGIGFRFGTINGVFLRIEGAFGSSAGAHFIMRFGHVF
jgi:outer membrane protein assembly factor BamA